MNGEPNAEPGAGMNAGTRGSGGLLRAAWPRLAAAAAVGALAAGSAVALIATSAWLIARAAQHPPVLTLMVAIVAVRAFGIGRGALRYLERLLSHDAAFAALAALRVRMYRRLEGLAPAGLPLWRRGDLLTRAVDDVEDVGDLALRGLLPFAASLAVFAGAVGLAVSLLPAAGLLLAGALTVGGGLAPWVWSRAAAANERQLTELRAARAALTVELTDHLAELTANDAADEWLRRIDAVDGEIVARSARSARLSGLGAALGVLAIGAAVWGSVVVGVPAVQAGSLSGPALAVLVLTPLALADLTETLPAAAQQLQRTRRSAQRVRAVLATPDPVVDPGDPVAAPRSPHLRLRDLQVVWPGRATPALHKINLDLPPGRRVAVVGPSGAGKSTLLAALLRFVDPSAGSITLDGVDVRQYRADDVRALMALCDQNAHVFDTTIEENVRIGRPGATDEEVAQALTSARLDDWIAELPDGLRTRVGEHGALISGGQRQRIALARALLADRPILLLDEPTSGLDDPTAAALANDLLSASAGRTTVFATHRLDGLDEVDEIVDLAVRR
jgi:thiol reductant ABC exporter CydC subunit